MAKQKPHKTATAEEFDAFAEAWISANVTVEQLLAIPAVATLALEEFNNKIIDDFDEEHEE